MKETKICHIITRLVVGGAQENTLLSCKGLIKKGYKVYLISGPTYGEEGSLEEEAKKSCQNFIIIKELTREISPIKDIISLIKIYKILKKEKFDIVHTHTSKAGIIGRIAAKLSKTKIIIHTPHGHIFHSYYGRFKTRIFWLLEKICAIFCNKIICLTETEKQEHIELKIAKENKFVVISSGVDFEKFKNITIDKAIKKKEFGIDDNKYIVGCVCRFVDIKGINFLLEAVPDVIKKIENIIFLIVGDGPRREFLEGLVKKLKIENYVIFPGFRRDINEILQIMDIFVFPSLNEGMGKAIIESQLTGIPVIASEVGGIKDLIINNKTGIFISPRNSKQIAEKIIYLVENPDIARCIGRCAKEHISEKYSSEYMVDEIEKLYLELLN